DQGEQGHGARRRQRSVTEEREHGEQMGSIGCCSIRSGERQPQRREDGVFALAVVAWMFGEYLGPLCAKASQVLSRIAMHERRLHVLCGVLQHKWDPCSLARKFLVVVLAVGNAAK